MTLSAVGPFAVVANIILGKFYLKEKVSLLSYIACFFLISGSIVTLVFSNYGNEKYNIKVG